MEASVVRSHVLTLKAVPLEIAYTRSSLEERLSTEQDVAGSTPVARETGSQLLTSNGLQTFPPYDRPPSPLVINETHNPVFFGVWAEMYTNLFDLLDDVRCYIQKNRQTVELADNPFTRTLGYKSQDREWSITLTDVKRSSLLPLTAEQQRLVDQFKTLEGRRELVKPAPVA